MESLYSAAYIGALVLAARLGDDSAKELLKETGFTELLTVKDTLIKQIEDSFEDTIREIVKDSRQLDDLMLGAILQSAIVDTCQSLKNENWNFTLRAGITESEIQEIIDKICKEKLYKYFENEVKTCKEPTIEKKLSTSDISTKEVVINSNDANVYNNMGITYAKQDNFDKAIVCYQKAIAIDPKDARVYFNMGLAYNKQGDYDKAIACFQKTVEIDPKDASAYFNMGIAYGRQGDYEKAIDCFQKAIAIDSKNADAYYNMGVAYRKQGTACFKKAAQLGNNKAQDFLKKLGYN